MKLGLFRITMASAAAPDGIVAVARQAEAAGFESVWAGEHVVLPDPQAPPSPMDPRDPALDPLFGLTWVAAHTESLRLGTGIVILPQRNPVVLAKEVASLDVLSGGRVIFGIGAGYLQPEFAAVGANYAERGAVTDEFLDAMQELWYAERPRFRGRHVSFGDIDAHPRPVQRRVPIVVGGHSAPAYRRAIARGDGWYGFGLTPQRTAQCLAGLRAAAGQTRRPDPLGELEISVTPRGELTRDDAQRFADLGVHRLIVDCSGTPDGFARCIEQSAEAVVGL